MPHIHLQTSANVFENDRILVILESLVERLAGYETIDSASIKAYHTLRETWRMGKGAAAGFIHCEVAVLTGRSVALRELIAQGIVDTLYGCFAGSIETGLAKITVEIREMDRDTYIK